MLPPPASPPTPLPTSGSVATPPQPTTRALGSGDPAQLTVQVQTSTGAGIPGAYVVVTSSAASVNDTTNGAGAAQFNVTTGTAYTVTAYKDWYLPEPVTQAVTPAGNQTITLQMDLVSFTLHVDGNRDGTVDDAPAQDVWEWGTTPTNVGAVILCNMDDDGGRANGTVDDADQIVDTVNDEPDIAEIQVRRAGTPVVPATWTLELHILDNNSLNARIFSGLTAASTEIVGPRNERYAFPNPQGIAQVSFGMEAVRFANADWDGFARIALTVKKPTSKGLANPVSSSSIAKVRVAPWMMPGPDENPVRVYAVNAGDNNATLDEIYAVVRAGRIGWTETLSADRWMQDCMEVGFSLLPRAGQSHRVNCTLRAFRNRELFDYPPTLLNREYGFYDPWEGSPVFSTDTTFDSFGNLECTPPVRKNLGSGNYKEYAWGRIYFGLGVPPYQGFNARVASFLNRQVVQAPFTLDTNWLHVGHVDEMMTFLPYSTGAQWKQWKLLIASPRKAYEILQTQSGNRAAIIFTGRNMRFGRANYPIQNNVPDFLTGNTRIPDPDPRYGNISGTDLEDFNTRTIQDKIDDVLTELETEIDLDQATDVIEVPVIFAPHNAAWTTCGALSADMVNMLILGSRVAVPKPFGPVVAGRDLFEDYLTGELGRRLGGDAPTVTFVDDWYTYHDMAGEVHCGTNTLRQPADLTGWLRSDAVKWWRFTP